MPSSTASQTPHLSSNPAQSALMEGLQPALRNTLSSLNINLDYELARYRYVKRGETPPGVTPPQFQPRRRSLNLINVPSPPPTQAPQATRASATPPPPPPNPRLQRGESVAAAASTSEVAALRSAIVQQSSLSPETYLASSEALLQSFDAPATSSRDEPSAASFDRSWTASILTPLGLGGLMLLLVASAGFGFILVNPSAASHLFQNTPLARFFPSEEEEDTEAIADAEAEDGEEATADFDGPPLTALGPDLSQREFTDLDLNDLSSLPSNSSALPSEADALTAEDPLGPDAAARDRTTAESPVVARESTPNAPQRVNQIPTRTTPAPQPSIPTYVEPAPAPAAPAPAPQAASQPAPPAVPAPTSQEPVSSYYVVTDYTGDPSLDNARSAVGDAYVRNFEAGARIQMGAFNTSEGAEALAEELRNQGIEAEILQP